MTLILETGFGVRTANSYVTTAFIDAYLAELDRATENGWTALADAVKEAHAIAATQYIDTRWGRRFKGLRLTSFAGANAAGLLVFADQPSADEVVVLGEATYTFKASLSTLPSVFEVVIGATTADTVANLIAAINGETGGGTTYSTNISPNQNATAIVDETVATQINLTARVEGSSGNDITLTTTAGNITPTGFLNGVDEGSQPLEFPRSSLFDQDGIKVVGIPRRLKEAASEYAVRSAGSSLYIDPTVDASGRTVTGSRKKIGPIEVETTFEAGAALTQLIRPYPAADRLLQDYVVPEGRVFR